MERRDVWMSCQHTKSCIYLYILLLVLSLFVVIWELSNLEYHVSIAIIEGFVTFALFLELCINVFVYRCQYFRNWVNVVDFVIVIICVIFFIVYVNEEPGRFDGLSDTEIVLLLLRYVFILTRLGLMFWRNRKRNAVLSQNNFIRLPSGDGPRTMDAGELEASVGRGDPRYLNNHHSAYNSEEMTPESVGSMFGHVSIGSEDDVASDIASVGSTNAGSVGWEDQSAHVGYSFNSWSQDQSGNVQ